MPSFSGLWNNEYGQNYAQLSNTESVGNAHLALSRAFARRLYGRASVRALLVSFIDGAVGDNASATHRRVKAERDLAANVLGGKRTIETHTSINRVTTAADKAKLLNTLQLTSAPTYPVDKAGVGGGGKRGW